MGMENGGGMSPAEAILVSDHNRGYGYGNDMWGGGYWMMFLFFLLACGNGGWGGWGGFGGFGGMGMGFMNGALTRAELFDGFNTQNIENGIRGIQNGLCDGFYAMNTTNLQGFHGVDNAICQVGYQAAQQANELGRQVAENRFANQQCCCETNRNIDAVRYENAKNTCDIVTAIKEDGAATRALMTQNVIQELRDRLEDRDRAILARDNQLSQQAQSAYLLQELKYSRNGYGCCGNGNGWGN